MFLFSEVNNKIKTTLLKVIGGLVYGGGGGKKTMGNCLFEKGMEGDRWEVHADRKYLRKH